jgi:hypothetical protein
MSLLSRLARKGHGSDGKPFDYETQCIADQQYVQQSLAELEKAIQAREKQSATQPSEEPKNP